MKTPLLMALLMIPLTGCDQSATAQSEAPTVQPKVEKTQPTVKKSEAVPRATIGTPAPQFSLKSTTGETVSLSQFAGKVVVLEWFNPDCPFVKVAHREGKLASQAAAHIASGGVWLAINSGAPGLQGHGLERNTRAVKEYALPYPVLLDESGETGKAYEARKTPHMYVIDAKGTLVYGGALDSTGGAGYEGKTFEAYLSDSLKAVAKGAAPAKTTTKAWGCSVKYGR